MTLGNSSIRTPKRCGPRAPSVSAGLAGGLYSYAVARGADAVQLATQSGFDPAIAEDTDARVAFGVYIELMRAAQRLTGDRALAVHFAAEIDMAQFSVVGLLALASQTMGEALVQLNRYGRLVVEVDLGLAERFRHVVRDGGLWLEDTRLDPNAFPELTETTFTRMITGPRRFLSRPHVLAAQMTHPRPDYAAELEQVFQCPIEFDAPQNALKMDPSVNAMQVAMQPRFVFGILSERADALMATLEQDQTSRAIVERWAMARLHKGPLSIEALARELGQSRQTLYRRLKVEGVTFEAVIDDLRRRLALDYLRTRRVSVNETAYLVGFSDPAAFSRAVKRWTGFAPRDVRRGLDGH